MAAVPKQDCLTWYVYVCPAGEQGGFFTVGV